MTKLGQNNIEITFFLRYLFTVLCLYWVSTSCSPVKYVGEGAYLLDKNKIVFVSDSARTKTWDRNVASDDLHKVIKLVPNREIVLGVKFHLRLYSLSNQERIDRQRRRNEVKVSNKNLKIDAYNEQLALDHPGENVVFKKCKKYKSSFFGENLRESGEAPVLLDSVKVEKSKKQINTYLLKKGFFNNVVTDTIIFKGKRAEVHYLINEKRPYTVSNLSYAIKDNTISEKIKSYETGSLIKVGENFDTDLLDKERTRITKKLLDEGYYAFNKEFIFYKVDSLGKKNNIDITLGVQNYKYKHPYLDSVIQRSHLQYQIKKIQIYADYDPKDDENYNYDVIEVNGIEIYFKNELKIKPALLVEALKIKQGEFYSQTRKGDTYKQFMSLGVFKKIDVRIKANDESDQLNVAVYCQQAKSQTLVISSDGLHKNGFFGIEGSMSYSHKNIFKGAERLQLSFTGALETQRSVAVVDDSSLFNTKEVGPKLSLKIPRSLLIDSWFKHKTNHFTELTSLYSYQERPDFTRTVAEGTMTWVFNHQSGITWMGTPASLSLIKIDKEPAFEERIAQLNDKLLAASYANHIIGGGKLAFIFNGQEISKSKNVFYTQLSVESAGNLLRLGYSLSGSAKDPVTNSYTIDGTRFAQFIKFSGDVRYYRALGLKSKVVYRAAAGLGIPLINLSEALPFEKSFFSGGANGMRAWKARSLGPGGYFDPNGRFDKIGDIQLESNVEFRFPLTSWVEGAWFMDAGNIWLINPDSLRTSGEFNAERFIGEIGLGSGLGLRIDLDFFVVRFDFAMPIKNPALPAGQRWIFEGGRHGIIEINDIGVDRNQFYRLQFNLGIGYPF